jgi:hypothetical protein
LDEYDFTLIDLNNVGDTDEKHVEKACWYPWT